MTNYIVSGLERSGTSLLMQILEKGGVTIVYDDSRKPDEHNPNGYFELENGKIIDKLIKQEFDFKGIQNKFIKITSYGLGYLPFGDYKIIYIQRDIDEIIDSTQRMSEKKFNRKKLKNTLTKLDKSTIEEMEGRVDINYVVVNYNEIISDYYKQAAIIKDLIPEFDIDKGKEAIEISLYRNRRSKVNKLSKDEEDLIRERLIQLGYL